MIFNFESNDLISCLEAVNRQIRRFIHVELNKRSFGLTIDQALIIEQVYLSQNITQNKLAEKVLKDPASVTRILDSLQTGSWVERNASVEDRRSHIICLSAGRDAEAKDLHDLLEEIREYGRRGFRNGEFRRFFNDLNMLIERYEIEE